MAYLAPEFEHDVFVSYSHGDPDGLGDSPLKSWTHAFIEALRSEILSLQTEFDDLSIWYDAAIDPTRHLTNELRQKVAASGILMILMSPRYLKSSWCVDEREWFKKQFQDRERDHGRVFVVQAAPTDKASWPDFFKDEGGNTMIGFSFINPETRRPFGWRMENFVHAGEEFAKLMGQLETKLTFRLRELRSRSVAEPASRKRVPMLSAAKRIYLHARVESAGLRDRLRSQLAADGLTPLTARLEDGAALKDSVVQAKQRFEAVKHCGALALVRADDNDEFIEDLYDIGVDARERVEEVRGAPLPCAVLDDSGRELPDFDCSAYGIRRFDLHDGNWRRDFLKWISDAQAPNAAPA